jgi:hypothetical protein
MQQFVRGVLESQTAKAKHVPQPPDATIAISFAEVNNSQWDGPLLMTPVVAI